VLVAVVGCGGKGDGRESDTGVTGVTLGGSATSTDGGESGEGGSGGQDGTGGQACESDEDCPAGEHCGAFSHECLGPTECEVDQDCDEGFVCMDGECSIGGECGGFQFEIEAVPPNVMILLDRSGSMDGSVPGSTKNRWEVAEDAVRTVTQGFDVLVRFGLATYSSCTGGGCSAGSIVVPILPMNAGNISTWLDTVIGVGSGNGMGVNGMGQIEYLCDSGDPETSTGKSLAALVGEPSLADTERENAILLITDGAESSECVDNGVDGPAGAAMLFAQDPSVRTYAVGFGDANAAELDAIAAAGGTVMGYQAEMPAELQMALDQIAQDVASCTFSLDQIPPDAAMIYVFFDKDPAGVPMDPNDGWTYDPATNSITFHGQACMDIKNGVVVEIDIVYGCNMPPPG
jgi:hypothetical protein